MTRLFAVSLAVLAAEVLADPVGLVSAPAAPVTRVGPQRSYVFYKDGLETLVLQPGFEGKGDEVGMLIPFPSPPSIRTEPDEIFAHLAAAIEPPEVIVNLRPAARPAQPPPTDPDAALGRHQVNVIAREAVGLYDVVTLAPSSAKALTRWLDSHGFKYPPGMAEICAEYVKAGWVFVAAKVRAAAASSEVHAMGFRFKAEKPVLPMRLAPFNAGEHRQIVYVLTDQPVRFNGLDISLVRRQLPGWRLLKNLVQPLPLRVIGGSPTQVSQDALANLRPRRDPSGQNGQARALFGSDLRAAKTGKLEPEDAGADSELKNLEGLTITVFDGDFAAELMKQSNLTLSRFAMGSKTNSRVAYDAKNDGPLPDLEGIRWEAP